MVTDHNTLTRLLAQKPGDLIKRLVGWVETVMPGLANRLRLLYRKGSHNEADPLSRRPDFSSEISGVSAATTWWGGEVPESGQPVLPEDATDVPYGATNENSSPYLDVSNVSADLLTQIRESYEVDPMYRQQTTLQVGLTSIHVS